MYFFRDYDDLNEEDLFISDADYIALIRLCISTCKYFTLSYTNENIAKKINKFLSPIRIRNIDDGNSRLTKLCIYECSDDAERFLTTYVNELFEWIEFEGYNNPEDIAFYREDGSIFFWSETHEGICAIIERDNEDVFNVIAKRGWTHYDKNNCGIWRCLQSVEAMNIQEGRE